MLLKTLFSVQEHFQKSKRSSHFDLRILDLKKNVLWSWAFPKLRFPEKGEKVLAIKTPDHKVSYMYFEGKLQNGDVVSLHDKGICFIIVAKYNIVILYFKGQKIKGAFNFIKLHTYRDSWIVTKSDKYSDYKQ
jgi:hypothetical protein